MSYVLATGVALVQIVVAFYGFWLVWRLLLPILPGPPDERDRIAPFAAYFTDPLVAPVSRAIRIPGAIVCVGLLVVVAALQMTLGRIGGSL